ncbi:MAG TPA: NAD(P)-dependent oxidoreductase [Hanamia sp.]|nr:NAD(P)-dependent oxidoreductase [Hanamia sp.]
MMKVAVVGSNSFLAQYIIRELVKNGIDPKLYGKIPSAEFPLLDFTLFQFAEHKINYSDLLLFDVIIYTAGAGIQANHNQTPEMVYELNSFIPIHLANTLAAHNYKGKLLTFGSYFEIGNESQERYYSEDEIVTSLNRVPNHYCISKRLLSKYFSSVSENLNFFHLILPNIYGKEENPQRLIPYLIDALKNKKDIRLTSGEQVRQYIHASDVAKIVLDIIVENYPKGFYNVCRNEAIQIKELVRKIFVECGRTNQFDELNLFGSKERSDTAMQYLLMNNHKSVYTFKYQPLVSIDEGIKTYLI